MSEEGQKNEEKIKASESEASSNAKAQAAKSADEKKSRIQRDPPDYLRVLLNTSKMQVTTNGSTVFFTNIGAEPLRIEDIMINDRAECTMTEAYGGNLEKTLFTSRPLMAGPMLSTTVTVKIPYAIDVWGPTDRLAIEEYLSDEHRHKVWLTSKLNFREDANGDYHANICLHPAVKQAREWFYSDPEKHAMCGFNGQRPINNMPVSFYECFNKLTALSLKGQLPLTQYGSCAMGYPEATSCNVCEKSSIQRLSVKPEFENITLKVGDTMVRRITCNSQVIRTTVVTDHGVATYEFH